MRRLKENEKSNNSCTDRDYKSSNILSPSQRLLMLVCSARIYLYKAATRMKGFPMRFYGGDRYKMHSNKKVFPRVYNE